MAICSVEMGEQWDTGGWTGNLRYECYQSRDQSEQSFRFERLPGSGWDGVSQRRLVNIMNLLNGFLFVAFALLVAAQETYGYMDLHRKSIYSHRDTPWHTSYGSYEKEETRITQVDVSIWVRKRLNNPCTLQVIWYFRDGSTTEVTQDIEVRYGRTTKVTLTSPETKTTDTKYAALGLRDKTGSHVCDVGLRLLSEGVVVEECLPKNRMDVTPPVPAKDMK